MSSNIGDNHCAGSLRRNCYNASFASDVLYNDYEALLRLKTSGGKSSIYKVSHSLI